MIIRNSENKWRIKSDFGDKRLNERAKLISKRLGNKYGQPISAGV
ncbi:MAG: hypothetical protein QNJ54_13750 [Prochloraceae cyanobacterium]|nr:hypothetical protein [Prochloraceae cyanobacterium]